MSDEMIRALDESGLYTGNLFSRTNIHINQIPHEAIHVWVFNEKGEILIQKRSKDKKMYANVWHISVAGHISKNDTPLSTAVREIKEELGLKVSSEELIYIHRIKMFQEVPETGLVDREFLYIYLLKVDSNIIFNLQTEEVAETKWIKINQFEEEILDPHKSKKYLSHPTSYYLQTINKVKQRIGF